MQNRADEIRIRDKKLMTTIRTETQHRAFMVGKTIRRALDMMASDQQGLSRVEVGAALNECVHLLQLTGSPLADQRSLLDGSPGPSGSALSRLSSEKD